MIEIESESEDTEAGKSQRRERECCHVAGAKFKNSIYTNVFPFPSISSNKQRGAAEACWAHNPEVGGSKPSSAI